MCIRDSTINGEYTTLATELAFTRAELAEVARNGWEVSAVHPSLREQMLAEIDRWAKPGEGGR